MRLSELRLSQGLQEVVTWGVEPLKELVNIMDEELRDQEEPDLGRLTFIMYELRNKLEDLEETLHRFDRETKAQVPPQAINQGISAHDFAVSQAEA